MGVSGDRPSVSVLLPVLNERHFLRDCLTSLVGQDYPDILEILVLDGGSNDGSDAIAARAGDPRVRVVDNPRITAAAAMNVGIAAAKGQVVCRADAHTLYAPDYVRQCVMTLLETGAENVGGPMRAVGTTNFGRAVAAVTSSRWGIGPGVFHYADRRVEADTVYLGCWWRATLEDLGGYDETLLQWAAEDQELNFRIRNAGGRVVVDPGIQSWYFPRETPRALARQYHNYGLAKASTLAKHGRLPTWRPLAPAALVLASVIAAVLGRRWKRVAIPAGHGLLCATVALRLGADPGVAPHRAFAAFEICHWSYGVGFWAGLFRFATGRGFDSRPTGHR
jgi:glycosyltransferase involved in cell wall biosynthesis